MDGWHAKPYATAKVDRGQLAVGQGFKDLRAEKDAGERRTRPGTCAAEDGPYGLQAAGERSSDGDQLLQLAPGVAVRPVSWRHHRRAASSL